MNTDNTRPRRRRGGRNRGGNRSHYSSQNRDRGPARAPAKKKNPIIAFFQKLFGGKSKPAVNGHSRDYKPREDRPSRAPRSESHTENRSEESRRESRPRPEKIIEENPEVSSEKLYIGNLSYDTSESDLYDHFSKVGSVNNVEIVRAPDGRSKGFGFVEMNEVATAQEASRQYHRTDFMGRQILVAGAKK